MIHPKPDPGAHSLHSPTTPPIYACLQFPTSSFPEIPIAASQSRQDHLEGASPHDATTSPNFLYTTISQLMLQILLIQSTCFQNSAIPTCPLVIIATYVTNTEFHWPDEESGPQNPLGSLAGKAEFSKHLVVISPKKTNDTFKFVKWANFHFTWQAPVELAFLPRSFHPKEWRGHCFGWSISWITLVPLHWFHLTIRFVVWSCTFVKTSQQCITR